MKKKPAAKKPAAKKPAAVVEHQEPQLRAHIGGGGSDGVLRIDLPVEYAIELINRYRTDNLPKRRRG